MVAAAGTAFVSGAARARGLVLPARPRRGGLPDHPLRGNPTTSLCVVGSRRLAATDVGTFAATATASAEDLVATAKASTGSDSMTRPAAHDRGASGCGIGSIVSQLYDSFNRCDVDGTADCFTEDVVYEDLLLGASTIVESREDFRELIQTHPVFVAQRACTALHLPPLGVEVKVDSIAEDALRGTVGVEWHVEVGGSPLALGRGLSFMRICPRTGLIRRAVDLVEAPWRVIGILISPFARGLRVVSRLFTITWISVVAPLLVLLMIFSDRPAMDSLRKGVDSMDDFRDTLQVEVVSPEVAIEKLIGKLEADSVEGRLEQGVNRRLAQIQFSELQKKAHK